MCIELYLLFELIGRLQFEGVEAILYCPYIVVKSMRISKQQYFLIHNISGIPLSILHFFSIIICMYLIPTLVSRVRLSSSSSFSTLLRVWIGFAFVMFGYVSDHLHSISKALVGGSYLCSSMVVLVPLAILDFSQVSRHLLDF